MPNTHPFSFQNPIHGTVTTAGKLLVVGSQVLFGNNHPVKVLVFMLCVFAGLCATTFWRPAYHGKLANRVRHFLDFGVLWVHLNTLMFYLLENNFWMRVCLPVQLVLTAGIAFMPTKWIPCRKSAGQYEVLAPEPEVLVSRP